MRSYEHRWRAGTASEAVSWLEIALRFDGANAYTAQNLCSAYYLLGRYGEAVETCDRALARNPGRSIQMMARPLLAGAYSQLGRDQDGIVKLGGSDKVPRSVAGSSGSKSASACLSSCLHQGGQG